MIQERLENATRCGPPRSRSATRSSPSSPTTRVSTVYVELCDGPGIDAEIQAMADLIELIASRSTASTGFCLQVIRAQLDGRFDDAERLARQALRIARLRHSEYAPTSMRMRRWWRWAQARSRTNDGRSKITGSASSGYRAGQRHGGGGERRSLHRRPPRDSRRQQRVRGPPSGRRSGCCASARCRRRTWSRRR